MKILSRALSCSLALAIAGFALSQRLPRPILIRNVTVVDVLGGRSLAGRTVLIKGGKIASIRPTSAKDARNLEIVDGAGKYLLPGLWDVHTHYTQDRSSLDLFIAHGVTGVRDMGSLHFRRVGDKSLYFERDEAIRAIVNAREAVRKGKILGPTIYTAGMIVTGPNPSNPSAPAAPHQIVVRTPAEARSTVIKLKKMGVDALKVHARLTRDCFFAIIEQARKEKLPVVGHTPLALNPIECAVAGMRSIEHMTGVWEYAHKGLPENDESMDPKRFEEEVRHFRSLNTYHVPTLVNYRAPAEAYRIVNDFDSEPELEYVVPDLALRWMGDWSKSDFTPEQSKAFRDSVTTLQDMTKRMVAGGVPIMAGTDAGGLFTYPGISLHMELELLNGGGLSPLQTLQTATIRPAEFLGIADRAGSVSKGKTADLLLLRGDPLKDIKYTRAIEAVIVRGRLLRRSQLDALLEKVRKRARPTRELMKTGAWGSS